MIPDTSPDHMARYLVTRHSDIGFVRSYIASYFGYAPTRENITALRDEHMQDVAKPQGNAAMSDNARRQAENRRRRDRDAAKRYRAKGRVL